MTSGDLNGDSRRFTGLLQSWPLHRRHQYAYRLPGVLLRIDMPSGIRRLWRTNFDLRDLRPQTAGFQIIAGWHVTVNSGTNFCLAVVIWLASFHSLPTFNHAATKLSWHRPANSTLLTTDYTYLTTHYWLPNTHYPLITTLNWLTPT